MVKRSRAEPDPVIFNSQTCNLQCSRLSTFVALSSLTLLKAIFYRNTWCAPSTVLIFVSRNPLDNSQMTSKRATSRLLWWISPSETAIGVVTEDVLHRAEIPGLKAATCDNIPITCGVSVSPKLGAYTFPFPFNLFSSLFPQDEGFDCLVSDPPRIYASLRSSRLSP